MRSRFAAFCLTTAVAGAAVAPPRLQPASALLPLATNLREEVRRFAVIMTSHQDLMQTRQIPATLHRPAGSGPFPLAIINHGRSPAVQRTQPGRQRFEPPSRYLVSEGFAVAVPARVQAAARRPVTSSPKAWAPARPCTPRPWPMRVPTRCWPRWRSRARGPGSTAAAGSRWGSRWVAW